jgi:hypothetical protein
MRWLHGLATPHVPRIAVGTSMHVSLVTNQLQFVPLVAVWQGGRVVRFGCTAGDVAPFLSVERGSSSVAENARIVICNSSDRCALLYQLRDWSYE